MLHSWQPQATTACTTLPIWLLDPIDNAVQQVLRDTLNCTLPIEIIYNGPAEMDAWAIQKFEVASFSVCHPLGCSMHARLARAVGDVAAMTPLPLAGTLC